MTTPDPASAHAALNPAPAPDTAAAGTVVSARQAVSRLWADAGLDPAALAQLQLTGGPEPLLPTSFAVATALQASVAAAALAAAEVGRCRGGPCQRVTVDALDAVREGGGHFTLDGVAPDLWDKLSGLYLCGAALGQPGWVRVHANFAHHRDAALQVLGLPPGDATERPAVTQALAGWTAEAFEQAVAHAGGVVAAVCSAAQWQAHPHRAAVAAQPLVALQQLDDSPAPAWPALPAADARPLQGLRVLDLTRILAGPVAGRTLAAYGADVMLVNSPQLPNIAAIADTSRGKLSVHVDLRTAAGRDTLRALVGQADVLLQGYRPGALAALGFGPAELAALRPGLVNVQLSAYGSSGPWGGRRGFDSLVQTATGFNTDEAAAFGQAEPRALPLQVLDYSAGFLLAFGTLAARLRQARQGGSWQVQVSLARTGQWLRSLGRCSGFAGVPTPGLEGALQASTSGFGALVAVRHAAQLSHTPPGWVRPSMPPGSHAPEWPAR